ncbi:tRNA-specific adenosine deaminase 1 isoform X2 [Centruroides vittatus]|uniref:tRNA-specific adenosine deaminase 1 isoform X2 n=1 Tax=Centruroides vittatus TaxID=120091 RepID=UPI00350F0ACB
MNNKEFADIVAQTCYEHYEKLPKTGKPRNGKEWTLLAAILITFDSENDLSRRKPHIIALATGSKCLGAKDLSPDGNIVNDSHAEILTRRAFLRYLYHQIKLLLEGKQSTILSFDEKGFTLKSNLKFHLFISHTPCGDASIFLKDSNIPDNLTNCLKDFQKRKCETSDIEPLYSKKLRSEVENNNSSIKIEDVNVEGSTSDDNVKSKIDIYRTGAKCVTDGLQDPKGEGINYHILGRLRTKPGRGNPTLSMSCSDKIAKWNVCGLQGALISHFLCKPIYLSTIIIGRCPFSREALYEAIVERTNNLNLQSGNYYKSVPILLQSNLLFKYSRQRLESEFNAVMPSPSVIWTDVSNKPLEVAVNGLRQGVTIKCQKKPIARLSICKKELFQQFISILKNLTSHKLNQQMRNKELITYYDYKMAAKEYQNCWTSLKCQCFNDWTNKPKELLSFVADE